MTEYDGSYDTDEGDCDDDDDDDDDADDDDGAGGGGGGGDIQMLSIVTMVAG